MITNALYLSAIWFIVSFVPLILFGKSVKVANPIVTIIWFAVVLTIGDMLIPKMLVLNIAIILLGVFWIWILRSWNFLAKTAWITMLTVAVNYLIYSFSITAFATANIIGYTLALVFFFIEAFSLFLSLSYAFEALDTICRTRWTRNTALPENLSLEPKVSLHLPSYNEPPEVVIKTLESLARLNYSNYEVLLIDNNTPDETTWKPLEVACQRLGERFKFFHLGNWPGFKSGALNFALSQTAKDSEFVGIIDSDYDVNPDFLKEIIPAFANKNIAFVQTPQDYRGSATNSFFKAAYYGYKYFFNVSMLSRNERNAIIFAGTMGLIRKSVLVQIGGWDEWCITEDAEASLRILKLGYEAVYINKSYGKGLMPLEFDAFKKQRFRWCFGGIQILKKHWEALLPWASMVDKDNNLTFAQKYYYLVGGLQWYNDLLNLFFAFFLILGGVLSLMPQIQGFRPFTLPLLIIPAVFLVTGLWRFLWVLRNALKLSTKEALNAMTNFFSLGWAVTLGSVQGLIQKQGVFLRTKKVGSNLRFISALGATQSETFIGLVCLTAGILFVLFRQNILIFALGTMLFWEGGLFLSAPFYSLVSLSKASIQTAAVPVDGRGISENFAARWIVLAMVGIIFAVIVLKFAPPPKQPAPYSVFQPKEVSIPGVIAPLSPTPSVSPTPTITPTPGGNPKLSVTPTPTISVTPTPSRAISPTSSVSPTPGNPKVSVSPIPAVSKAPGISPPVSPAPASPTPTP